MALLVLAAAAARTGVVAARPRSERLGRRRRGEAGAGHRIGGRRQVVAEFGHEGSGEAHLAVVVVAVRFADRRGRVGLEDRRVPSEERANRPCGGGGDRDVAFDQRARRAVRLPPIDQRVGVGARHRPPVLHRFAPHRRRQPRGGVERQQEQLDARATAFLEGPGLRMLQVPLEIRDGGEDRQPVNLAQRADDGDAGAVDVQGGDVHPEHLGVAGDRPRLRREQGEAGVEQLLDRGGRYAAPREVARRVVRVVRVGLYRRDHLIDKRFQFGRRREVDRYRPGDFRAYLDGGGGVGDADEVGPARRADQGLGQGAAQGPRDRAPGVLGHDGRLADDEPLGQLHPEHDVGTVGLFAVVDEEGRREATADPLAEEPRLARGRTRVRGASRLQAGALSIMAGSYRRRRSVAGLRRHRQSNAGEFRHSLSAFSGGA